MKLKQGLATIINKFGYEIKRKPRFSEVNSDISDPLADQQRLLNLASISAEIIFDVGANIGQSALKYRQKFPASQVHSFEPISSCYAEIVKIAKRDHKIVPHQIALDSKVEEIDFYEMHGSQTSSSLLPSRDVSSFYPDGYFRIKQKLNLNTETIDFFCEKNEITHINILKLDTQGTEDKVLLGADRMLRNQSIDLIFSEISFVSIYADNVLFFQLCDLLHKYNYHLYSIYECVRGSNGVMVGSDALFLRDEMYNLIL